MQANRWKRCHLCKCLTLLLLATGCENKPKTPDNGPITPGPYVVASEADNLSTLSLRAYGKMDHWYCLLNANLELCKRPEFELVVGETINIPSLDELDTSLPKSIFPESLPADYIVMPGDSLHFIADNCYGSRDEWERIYDANRHILSEKVREDTRRLIAGQVLHIPAK